MIITHQNYESMPQIFLNGTQIQNISEIKFLGMKLDEKLTFKCHTNSIAKKLSKNLGMLYRISAFMPLNVLNQLYFAYIQSHLCFGLPAWGACAPTNLSRIVGLRARAAQLCEVDMRALNCSNLYKHTCMVKFMRDFVMDDSFNLAAFIPQHFYQTRHRLDFNLNIPFICKNRCRQSFVFNSIIFWNELPQPLKEIDSIRNFKKMYKAFLLNSQLN